jgi:hypothetical protein
MKTQTYTGPVTWVIVDDCLPETTAFIPEDFKPNWTILKVYPRPEWEPGQNSQARNISAGIWELFDHYSPDQIEAIFFIEDDDYYKPIYLEMMVPRLPGYQAIGETNTIYYNVYYRRHITNGNTEHASLFQTAISVAALPEFEKCYKELFIDYVFFAKIRSVNLFQAGNLAIGIKGLPGRSGIGSGHSQGMMMAPDPEMDYLKYLIGNDYKIYRDGKV